MVVIERTSRPAPGGGAFERKRTPPPEERRIAKTTSDDYAGRKQPGGQIRAEHCIFATIDMLHYNLKSSIFVCEWNNVGWKPWL